MENFVSMTEEINVCQNCGGERVPAKFEHTDGSYVFFIVCKDCKDDNGVDWTEDQVKLLGFDLSSQVNWNELYPDNN